MPTIHPAHAAGKTCTECKQFKPAAEFGRKGGRKLEKYGYLKSRCRSCESAVSLAAYHADPDAKRRHRERAAKIYRSDPKTAARKTAEWRAANPDKARAVALRSEAKRKPQRVAYRKANAAMLKLKHAEYNLQNVERIRARSKEFYAANRKLCLARQKASAAKKPQKYRMIAKAAKHRRKVRLLTNAPCEKFTDVEIFERDGWVCRWCKGDVDPTLAYPDPNCASLDHVHPIVRGGGHTRNNVCCTHLRCNLIKKDRLYPAA